MQSGRGAAVEVPLLPLARISQRDPAVPAATVVAAAPTFAVTDAVDGLSIDRREFRMIHAVGIQKTVFRNAALMRGIGPGTYEPQRADEVVRPAAPHLTLKTHGARLQQHAKDQESLEEDERASYRKNIAALRSLWLPGAHVAAADVLAAPEDVVEEMMRGAPRWLRPTGSARSRRLAIAAEAKAAALQAKKQAGDRPAPPMVFTLSARERVPKSAETTTGDSRTSAKPPAIAGGADSVKQQPVAPVAAAPQPAAAPSQRSTSASPRHQAPTPEERMASFRKALQRPSSASTRLGSGRHWTDGAVQHCSIPGVYVVSPRDGKTDAVYDVSRGEALTKAAPSQVSLGTSPRFLGERPIAVPPKPPQGRPESARVPRPPPVEQ